MSFRNIPGQNRTKRVLQQAVRTGHIPHALLFSGMAGVGKNAMAREFAKLLNCLDPREMDSCDVCTACRKIDGGHHPDLIQLQSEGAYIKVDQIRGLKARLQYRPFEGRWRVLILQNAQHLKEEAGNALLKLLEEPPQHNIFVLTVLESQMLLPTIVSRCCHIRFQPLEDTWIKEHMIGRGLSPAQADEVARLAQGSLDRACQLLETNLLARCKELLERLQQLDRLSMVEFFTWMGQWAQKSEDLEQDLECIKFWLRDVILGRLNRSHESAFRTHEPVHSGIQAASLERLFRLHDQLDEALRHLRQNANKQLLLEGVGLAIKDVLYGKGSGNSISQRREGLLF